MSTEHLVCRLRVLHEPPQACSPTRPQYRSHLLPAALSQAVRKAGTRRGGAQHPQGPGWEAGNPRRSLWRRERGSGAW